MVGDLRSSPGWGTTAPPKSQAPHATLMEGLLLPQAYSFNKMMKCPLWWQACYQARGGGGGGSAVKGLARRGHRSHSHTAGSGGTLTIHAQPAHRIVPLGHISWKLFLVYATKAPGPDSV